MELLNVLLSIQGLPNIRVADVIDVLLVAFLIYEIYKLVRGTNVLRHSYVVLL